jgi:hypothetical protein
MPKIQKYININIFIDQKLGHFQSHSLSLQFFRQDLCESKKLKGSAGLRLLIFAKSTKSLFMA